MNQQLPIFCDVARWFSYAVSASAQTSALITIGAAGGTGYGYTTIMPQNYFVLTNFRASSNYDNAVSSVGVFAGFGSTQAPADLEPFIPNNFTVSIQRGQNNTYSNNPMTQADICSSGYSAGKQLPIPVVYGPRFNFAFTFTDLTGLFLTEGDGSTVLPLEISMFMEGYSVPISQWAKFLNYFPSLKNVMAAPSPAATS